MDELKPCPFCGGEGDLVLRRERVGYGGYEKTLEFHVVKCVNCESSGKEFRQDPLCDYTSYTVQDFRDNPVLRAKVEDEYEDYIKQAKELAIQAWNTRSKRDDT